MLLQNAYRRNPLVLGLHDTIDQYMKLVLQKQYAFEQFSFPFQIRIFQEPTWQRLKRETLLNTLTNRQSKIQSCSTSRWRAILLSIVDLEDFDKLCHPPADNVGKLNFTKRPETREQNCYTGVHPIFFIVAFLDPHTRKVLRMVMVPAQCEELCEMILVHMMMWHWIKKQRTIAMTEMKRIKTRNLLVLKPVMGLILHLFGCLITPTMMVTWQLFLEET
jgi:hypothetical protein